MRRHLPLLIVAAVALFTVAGGMMLYRAKRPPLFGATKNGSGSRVDAGGPIHVRGPSNAPVALEEFADFQCRACGTLAGAINEVERDYRQRVRVIFRHFPLAGHKHAYEAAVAAEAAALQGRFWDMHDLLYREQEIWSKAVDVRALFENYARTLGLNIARFKKDMEREETKARILLDQQQGRAAGVTSTPTVLINNRLLPPTALNAPGLRKAIAAELRVQPSR
jgi:protein-disulfide isomerase